MLLLLAAALTAATMTPAEIQMQEARSRIETGASTAKSYTDLAIGMTRRARETGDAVWYDRAVEALDRALAIAPDDAGAMRTSAWVRMGRHEFAEALGISRRYEKLRPGDPVNLSVMGDALMELGRYDEAESAYQRMVDTRPGPASYSRVAYARELRGDVAGALDLMTQALNATAAREREDRAWLLCQVGHLHELGGDRAAAEDSYRAALESFPGYHYALAALAQTALLDGRAAEALTLAQAAIDAAPHAERYLTLADAQRAAGLEEAARASEDRFETLASANIGKHDNENHDLVLYYVERRPDPARALAIARRETTMRRDVHTMDRLALALDASGRRRAARRLMSRVLATGTRDPLILEHARMLEERTQGFDRN